MIGVIDPKHLCRLPIYKTLECKDGSGKPHTICRYCISCGITYHIIKDKTSNAS